MAVVMQRMTQKDPCLVGSCLVVDMENVHSVDDDNDVLGDNMGRDGTEDDKAHIVDQDDGALENVVVAAVEGDRNNLVPCKLLGGRKGAVP